MELLQSLSLPIISTVVYTIIEWLKKAINNEKFNKFIPFIAVIIGGLIGIWAFYLYPSIIPAENLGTAITIGVVSGGFSTWSNEASNVFRKNKNDNDTNIKKED